MTLWPRPSSWSFRLRRARRSSWRSRAANHEEPLRIVAILIIGLAAPASAQFLGVPHIEGSCDLAQQFSGDLSSYAWAQYYNPFGVIASVEMLGTHKIAGGNSVIASLAWGVRTGYYSGTRSAMAQDGICYQASNTATGYPLGAEGTPSASGSWSSAMQGSCAGGGGKAADGYDPWTDVTLTDTCYYQTVDCMSPIILNLDRGGYELSGPSSPVWFDLNADGKLDQLNWTAAGADIGFLVCDRNSNGIVDNGSELFGDHTPLLHGGTAQNGFEALAEFDENRDGVIDATDSIWPRLSIWIDRDHDGFSTADEIVPIRSTAVTAIAVSFHWTGRRDRFGNMYRYEGQFYVGADREILYDVYLRLKK